MERRSEPFQQFILKVVSRCNLSCDYCYVYEMADQSWRQRPTVMALDVLAVAAHRIGEHANTHGLRAVRVILHGGEPMLAGPEWLGEALTILRAAVPRRVSVNVTVQTNGLLLDDEILAVLHRHRVRVGISLDGPAAAHDRHRTYASGRGSHAQVMAALALLGNERHRGLFAGLLCVVDPANDPLAVYEELLRHAPPAVDFMLPHGTWSAPPPGRTPGDPGTPYADWLIPVFDRWYEAPRRPTDVRLFSEIIHVLLGGRSGTEDIGLTPSSVLVIETDGALEQVDALKAAYPGAPATGLTVADGPFDLALGHPAVVARQQGVAGLSAECRRCEIRDVCGGGYYPHRYRAGSGFANPSVYCPDLLALIRHIRRRVHADLARLSRQVE
ncbi:FxsB family cyclophane-forming radical SAM/SPASM peptide maturase [Pseudofrankia sp. BMG5.36]|uniref:FxsB family cyclophane-forming radical SAM/SPASM peptide maturase n=1 Tax=Pseudofrankia sp. BMG5.36 TaxID=1834512 RepID=UPI0009F38BB9